METKPAKTIMQQAEEGMVQAAWHQPREPVGEWILLDAETWVGPDSVGIAAARLADTRGYFGRAVQSVIFEKR